MVINVASYQVGGQPEQVSDTLVVRGFIATAGLDENPNFGGWGVVLQRRDHQSAGQLAYLSRARDRVAVCTVTHNMYACKLQLLE